MPSRRQTLPVAATMPVVTIVPPSQGERFHQSGEAAKFAAYPTDMEIDGYSVCADVCKEFAVIRFICLTMTILTGALIAPGVLFAQTTEPLAPGVKPNLIPPPADFPPSTNPIVDPNVQQASGCCGTSTRSGTPFYGCSNNLCIPGRAPCSPCNSHSLFGRLCGGLFDGICCPDPCHEPRWIAEANAAFFQDSPRPVTQTRIRWDAGFSYRFPDTAEFFNARFGKKGFKNAMPSLGYDDLTLYQEVAAGSTSAFVEMAYRSIDPINNPSAAGLSDMNVGVKTILLDTELLLLTMQVRTFIPIGAANKGLGTGHASIEPALMAALKITSSTYLQTQIADWIPLGGEPDFAGSVIHYHASLNQSLLHHGNVQVVGTLEFNGFSFRGQFTDFPGNAIVGLDGSNFFSAGPGVRFILCDRFDLGVGTAFGFGNNHGPAQLYRTELRIRF